MKHERNHEHEHEHESAQLNSIVELLNRLHREIHSIKEYIMATRAEEQAQLENILAVVTEIGTEVPAKLEQLRALIVDGGGTTPAIDTLLTDITNRLAPLKDVANLDPPG